MQEETKIQIESFQWQWEYLPEYREQLFAVPNGGLRKKSEAMILKQSGTVPGIPDMCFLISSKTFLFEFKTPTGTFQPNQKKIRAKFIPDGFPVYAIRSFEQFKIIFIFLIMQNEKSKFKLKQYEQIDHIRFFGLTEFQFRYEMKVFDHIFRMTNGQSYLFNDICEPENVQLFKDTLKKFIILEIGEANGFYIEFKDDHSGFRKMEFQGITEYKDKHHD